MRDRSTTATFRFFLSLILLAAASSSVSGKQVTFESEGRLELNSSSGNDTVPRLVELVDLDIDGDLDIVVRQGGVTKEGNLIAWLENTQGQAAVWSYAGLDSGVAGDLVGHAIGDFNRDGSPDVALTRNGGRIDLLTLDRGTPIALLPDADTTGTPTGPLAAGDVNRDGTPDVVGFYQDWSVRWWAPQPSVGWTGNLVSAAPGGATRAFAVRTGDLDNDGDLDIVVSWDHASSFLDTLYWYENSAGDGSVWSAHDIATGLELGSGSSEPRSLSVGDVDNDGDLDVVAVQTFDTITFDAYAWYNPLSTSSWPSQRIGRSEWSSLHDLDGDGDLDVLASTPSAVSGNGSLIRYYDNDLRGVGSFLPALIQTSSESSFFGDVFTVAGDLDGDGDPDVVTAEESKTNLLEGIMRWQRNQRLHRSAIFPTSESLSDTGAPDGSATTIDRDGDGTEEILVTRPLKDDVSLYVRDSASGNWSVETVASAAGGAIDADAADFDRNGDMDIVVAERADDTISVYSQLPGTVTWVADGPIYEARGSAPVSLDVADFNGDGTEDVVAALAGADSVAVLINPGSGSSWRLSTVSTTSLGAASVKAFDLDRDGDMDVLSASSGDSEANWHENTSGDASTWTTHFIASVSGACAIAPLPFDGVENVLVGGPSDLRVFKANTTLTSWSELHRDDNGLDGCSLDTGDLDGDGDIDLIAGFPPDAVLWLKRRNSVSVGEPFYEPGGRLDLGSAFDDLAVGDSDGDGDLDLGIALQNAGGSIEWRPNRGGQFRVPTAPAGQGYIPPGSRQPLLRLELERARTDTTPAQDPSWVELSSIRLKFEQSPGVPLLVTERDAIVASHHIYLDDEDGVFEPGIDTEVSVQPTSLADGVLRLSFIDSVLAGRTYVPTLFYAVETTADADAQSPASFLVTHLLESSPEAIHFLAGEDETSPADPEYQQNISTGMIGAVLSTSTCHAPVSLQLDELKITTTIECEAGESITSDDVTISGPDGHLALRAGAGVELLDGFTVAAGGSLEIELDATLLP
jgi:hypothetical protein